MKWYIVITVAILVLAYFGFKDVFNQEYETPSKSAIEGGEYYGAEDIKLDAQNLMEKQENWVIDKSKQYAVLLKTDLGNIKIALNTQATPITVNNFVYLAGDNFYNGTIFHRTIANFMIQGGDPLGTGQGGPGYTFDDEPFEGEYKRGTVAMANRGPNTNGSQFFIMHTDQALPKSYVIFGQVTEGMDVVDKIATAPVEASATGEMSKPTNPIQINSVEIIEM